MEISVLETGDACCVRVEPDVSNCVNVSTRDTMVVPWAQIMPYSTSYNMWLAERVNAHPEGQPPSKRRCERMTGFESVKRCS